MGKLFGTDGVRGVAGRYPLTEQFVRRLGWAAGTVLAEREPRRPKRLFIVRDPRSSGPVLLRALAEGLGAAGFSVLDGGVLPTPAVAALIPSLPVVAGAVISASHNPAAHNGVKFFGPGGHKLEEDWEEAIERRALSKEPLPPLRLRVKPFLQARNRYIRFLKKCWPAGVSLRGVPLVLDCAQGATSTVAPDLFRQMGAQVTVLSASPNGRNINRQCGALHPQALAQAVRRTGARLGVAFDGDGDRAIFVDEAGHPRDGDAVLLAAARHLKVRGRLTNNSVVVTVMSNLGLHRALDALGFQREVTAVGDKYVWQGMRKTGAALGGEPSGHVIFRDFLPTGDGILTALQVAALLVETGRSFSSLTSLAVHYPQVLLNVPVRERTPLEKIPGFSRALAEVNTLLGDTGRTLVRYSGTEPLLRIMIEGPDRGAIESHAEALARLVRAA
ncbi:MAG: phosphoglucosamine mutase [Elusimicrobia bacterium]|jgi:phosphoglucosamine mutase|nr:phosphoglucosamine mutase [Elusimicrobiota bacterium]